MELIHFLWIIIHDTIYSYIFILPYPTYPVMHTSFTDINECISGSAECHNNATCTNTNGSYECTCDSGFSGDGFNCSSEIGI